MLKKPDFTKGLGVKQKDENSRRGEPRNAKKTRFCFREHLICLCALALGTLCALHSFNLACSPVFCAADYSAACACEVYLYNSSSGCKVVRVSAEQLSEVKKGNLGNVSGECLFFDCALPREEVEKTLKRLRAEFSFSESGEDFSNYYFYSPLLPECVYVNGRRVNLHLSFAKGKTSLAYPLAFGGY